MESQLRVVHQFSNAPSVDGLVDQGELESYAAFVRLQEGAIEAEPYASLDGGGDLALLELWEDQHSYAEHWSRVVERSADDLVLRLRAQAGRQANPSEFYAHQFYALDRVWVADALKERKSVVVWPAGGPVRIALQLALSDSEQLRLGLTMDEQQTQLEPGCHQYQWYQGIEAKQHFLLLELWESQFIYDNHWNLRLKTAPATELPMAERERGTNGIEFYRQQPFSHLYDRWLPSEPSRWSETVVWPW